jgi:beta-glucosidase
VKVTLYTDQFGYYSNNGVRQWNIQRGKFIIKVGASSQDIRLQQEVSLAGNPVAKPLRNHYFSETSVE